MTNFSDQLFTDLMREHAATLRRTELAAATRRHPGLRQGAWAAGGAGALAVAITASLAAFGGTAEAAYAVTPHSDGTVTVSVSDLSGVTGATAALRKLGARVVVVPARDGCPSMDTLPPPRPGSGETSGSVSSRAPLKVDSRLGASKQAGTITVQARGIPAGDLLVIAAASSGHALHLAARLTIAPAPACVSLPADVPGDGHTFRSNGVPGSGGGTVSRNSGAKSAGPGPITSGG